MASQSVPRIDVVDILDSNKRASIRRVAFASFIGTMVESYDFIIYAMAAALVFPKLFFPQYSAFAGTLASFATFGVGFIARPLGGVVFGHFGDRVGRKSVLIITLLLMGSATLSIGLLPTFEVIGVLAPVFLVVLRFVQGFAFGGEWGGATLMAVEHAPQVSRNFYACWPQLGIPVGLILSTTVLTAFSFMTSEHFMAWGWRIPFLLSVVLIAVGLFVRIRLVESPAFEQVKARGAEARMPLLELLQRYPGAAILAAGMVLTTFTGFYVVTTFTLSYLTGRFGIARNVALAGVLLAGVGQFAGLLIFALLADRIGKRAIALSSAGCLVLLSYPYFWLVNTGLSALIWLAMGGYMVAVGALFAVMGVLLAELFETRLRYSGISFGYQVGGMLGGAPAPIISAALIHWSGGASWPVATYLEVISLISFASVWLAARLRGTEIIEELNTQPNEA